MGDWEKAIGSWLMLYVLFWLINGWPADGIRDSIVGRIAMGREDARGGSNVNLMLFWDEQIEAEFEATMRMGVRRRSNVVGQMFDYLRLSGMAI